jgi:sugar-specific transcriptional regulator TrmB
VTRLQGNTVEKALQNFGLTRKETQIYIYLAKHGVQKGVEIAERTKTAKAVVYRILKILHRKGVVESTLESPVRFKAVPFETLLDLKIKDKHEEAHQIERAKKDLIADWSKINNGKSESPIEKFVVIEGNRKIYNKIYQMVKQTKNQLFIIATVSGIMRSDRYGITNEIITHPLKNKISFRLLTDVTSGNSNSIRFIKRKLEASASLRGRSPELGFKPFPRMVIRDQEEILFFITPNTKLMGSKKEDTCLCTNCKSMIEAFCSVFENLWQNSVDLSQNIKELEKGVISNQISKRSIFPKRNIDEVFESAKEDLLILTSSEGLKKLPIQHLKKISNRGVSIKIMSPITNENFSSSKKLLDFCELRHIETGYHPSILADKENLFQVDILSSERGKYFLIEDIDYVNKTRKILNSMWLSAFSSLPLKISEFLSPNQSTIIPKVDEKSYSVYRKTIAKVENEVLGFRNADEIVRKFVNAKEPPIKDITVDVPRAYQSTGHAIVQPPSYFNLPKLLFHFYHVEKKSSMGREDAIQVAAWMDTPKGPTFVPVVMMGDNPKSHEAFKIWFKGLPLENNIKLVNSDVVEIAIHGKTMFAAWSMPISLFDNFVIPPACMIIQGYGNLKTGSYVVTLPSGYSFKVDTNGYDAFVTFIHPKSKYSGPGTEGYLGRDEIMEAYLSK